LNEKKKGCRYGKERKGKGKEKLERHREAFARENSEREE
jgi:hypothetical protein